MSAQAKEKWSSDPLHQEPSGKPQELQVGMNVERASDTDVRGAEQTLQRDIGN